MTEKDPLLSVIILNYNGEKFLNNCLNSVKNTNYSNIEVILVDNASKDNSVQIVKNNFQWVKLLESKLNLGYAEGNNYGARNANGKYLIFLNFDTEVHPNWIENLVKVMESNKEAGACACKVLQMDNKNILDSAGVICDILGFPTNRGQFQFDDGKYNIAQEVFSVYGAAFIIRRNIFDKIGLFDSDYFIQCEEFDLSWRLRLLGYKVFFVPSSIVYHKSGAHIRKNRMMQKGFNERNRLQTMLKNYSALSLLMILPIYLFLKSNEILIHLAMKSKTEKVIIKSFIWNIKNLPQTLRKRNRVQKLRVVSDRAIVTVMKKYSLEIDLFLNKDIRTSYFSELQNSIDILRVLENESK